MTGPKAAGTAGLNPSRAPVPDVISEADRRELASYVRRQGDTVEGALVERDRAGLADAPVGPDAVVDHLFTDAFVAEHTDFPSLEAFLESAGAESLWDLSRWIDWVLDWHVLGNTRFWSWEWMVNAAVELGREAAGVGPVRCRGCDGFPVPVTGSAVEEPGRVDEVWIRFACDCGATGELTVPRPDGDPRADGEVALDVAERALPRPTSDDGEE